MADEIDIANDLIDNELSRALGKLKQKLNQNENAEGSEFCIECEEGMPIERKNLGFKLCISCATEAERREQMFMG